MGGIGWIAAQSSRSPRCMVRDTQITAMVFGSSVAVMYTNGQPMSIIDALTDRQIAPALSDEGRIQRITELLTMLALPPVEAASTSTDSNPR